MHVAAGDDALHVADAVAEAVSVAAETEAVHVAVRIIASSRAAAAEYWRARYDHLLRLGDAVAVSDDGEAAAPVNDGAEGGAAAQP